MNHARASIRRVEQDSTCHVTILGELDLSNADELRAALDGSASEMTVVVDTTELTFIDSTGLAVLVEARRELGSDRFKLIAGPATERILELTQLQELFRVD